MRNAHMIFLSAMLSTALVSIASPGGIEAKADEEKSRMPSHQQRIANPYTGMWVTRDGHIRQELLPNGRYDEARGSRRSAYQGRYEVTGTRILYWDDTGFTADGTFVTDDELHHGGMVFYRERK